MPALGDAPGATGWVNGGNQAGLPVYVKKLVHWVAVTCFNVATVGFVVGGDVVEGNHAAISSAKVLGMITKLMTEPVGTSADTLALSFTIGAATFSTEVPGGMLGPYTDIPTAMPAVAPTPPKVKSGVLIGQSAVVVALMGRMGSMGMVTNAIDVPLGTSAVTAVLSVTFGEFTDCTVVPKAIFVPRTDMPALIPAVLVKGNIFPEGVSAVVLVWTGGLVALKVTGLVTPPNGAALRVMTVVVSLWDTVVPATMFVPLTVIPLVMLSVAAVAAKVKVGPTPMFTLGDAVTVELPELKVITVLVDTPPAPSPALNVTVTTAATCVTTVPGAMFVPLTGIPTPMPFAPPSKVSVDPAAAMGVADKGGMMKP